ncbi:MAG: hypothetical protein AAF645_12530 [Myxococcota bacterium]
MRQSAAGTAVDFIEQTYFHIELYADGLIWLRRTPEPYATLNEVRRGYYEFFEVADEFRAKRTPAGALPAPLGFLYDVRKSPPPRSDPEFEQVHEDFRPRIFHRTSALVVLVKTSAGQMQMTRMGRKDGSRFATTQSETDAVAWVREMMAETSPLGE